MLLFASSPGGEPHRSPPASGLFADLLSGRDKRRGAAHWTVSLIAHALAVGALLLIPLLWPEPLPERTFDPLRLLLYDPPPPPPLPPPRGSGLLERSRAKDAARPAEPPLTEPPQPPLTLPPAPALAEPAIDEPGGTPDGSPTGVAEGMEGGVEGGMVGGVPGGVIGGVIGGTGTGPVPVMDYDRPPRPLRTARPEYPSEAFVKKVEGTVVLEILIDDLGRVVHVRVVHSVPLLDAAAVRAVKTWIFEPAIRKGHAVPTLATAPVTFSIY